MKSFCTLLFSVFMFKGVWATGYSGLNNDLVIIYGVFIGMMLLILGMNKAIKYIRMRLSHKTSTIHS
jgi:hypothetical protein